MKVKFKTLVTCVHTIASPFHDEIGRHEQKDLITICGKCEKSLEQAYFYKNWNYCPYCGEKIEWVEKPGKEH